MFSLFTKEELTECNDIENMDCELLAFQFTAKSNLGWISWKEREASLFRLLERIFNAQSCCMNFTNRYNEIIIEFSAPSSQIERYLETIYNRVSKYVRQGQLACEIDKVHGVLKDCVLAKLVSVPGKRVDGKSSLESIEDRVLALTSIDYTRKREIVALTTQIDFLRDKAQAALDIFEEEYDQKLHDKCISKFQNIEKRIIEIVDQDLKILRSDVNSNE